MSEWSPWMRFLEFTERSLPEGDYEMENPAVDIAVHRHCGRFEWRCKVHALVGTNSETIGMNFVDGQQMARGLCDTLAKDGLEVTEDTRIRGRFPDPYEEAERFGFILASPKEHSFFRRDWLLDYDPSTRGWKLYMRCIKNNHEWVGGRLESVLSRAREDMEIWREQLPHV